MRAPKACTLGKRAPRRVGSACTSGHVHPHQVAHTPQHMSHHCVCPRVHVHRDECPGKLTPRAVCNPERMQRLARMRVCGAIMHHPQHAQDAQQ